MQIFSIANIRRILVTRMQNILTGRWRVKPLENTRRFGHYVRSGSENKECSVHVYNINLLKPTGHVMHQQFDIQQLYVLPTLYLCVLYLSENKQRLVPLTA